MNNIASAISYRNPASSGSGRIILVGTAHVSDRSVAEVNEVTEKNRRRSGYQAWYRNAVCH